MKHVKVEYRTAPDSEPVVLFDGDVDEVQWSDGPGGFSVSGKMRRQSGGGGAASFLEKIAASRKAQTAEMVSEKREQLNNEAAVQHLASASAVSSAETG